MVKTYDGLDLIFSEVLLNKIGRLGMQHHPNEFGGFLVGKYSEDFKKLYVDDFILPKKYKGHRYTFERSTIGLEEQLEKLFLEKNQYYIGEWHTHPDNSINYSQTDLIAMREIAQYGKVTILNPVLLILSISKLKINAYKFYIYKDKTLLAYD
ncbi:MAG: Mov34/MPN/PAD-1 family protein [Gelidibacter sp.]